MKFRAPLLMRRIGLSTLFILVTLLSGCELTGSESTKLDPRNNHQKWLDNTIEFEAGAWNNKPPFKGEVRVSTSAYNGKVVLMGQAKTTESRQLFEEKVASISHVKQVHNQVRVKPLLTLPEQNMDTWITTKVRSSIAEKLGLKGNRIKVITEDREVFLLGFVDKATADSATEIAREIKDVKQVIRGFNLTQ